MVSQHSVNQLDIAILFELLNPDHCRIEPGPEAFVLIQDKDFTAAHAGPEIFPGLSKDHHNATGHILASMIANSFDHRDRAGIAHRKPFTAHPVEIRLATRCAIQYDISDDDILRRDKCRALRRIDSDPASGKPFANIVVSGALYMEA